MGGHLGIGSLKYWTEFGSIISQQSPIFHTPSPAVSTPQPSHSLAPVDDQTLAYQEESYEDYGQYEADQSYEGSMMETGMMGQGGADGNKGLIDPLRVVKPVDI